MRSEKCTTLWLHAPDVSAVAKPVGLGDCIISPDRCPNPRTDNVDPLIVVELRFKSYRCLVILALREARIRRFECNLFGKVVMEIGGDTAIVNESRSRQDKQGIWIDRLSSVVDKNGSRVGDNTERIEFTIDVLRTPAAAVGI